MEKILEKIFDIKQIPTKLLIVVFLSTSLILFVPEQFLTKLKLQDFIKEYGKYIGISFIISFVLLIVVFITYVTKQLTGRRYKRNVEKQILKDINYLDPHEKSLLREFFIRNGQTLPLPIDDATVVGLTNKHIIYTASSTGFVYTHGVFFPFSITDIALKNLTFEMIDLPENPTEQEKIRVMNERPRWAK